MLNSIEERIRAIIEERDQGRRPLTKALLGVVAILYGVAVGTRIRLYKKGLLPTYQLPCRVIAIGNLTTGGTGKTPMTLYVARLLQKIGKRVVIISRGYKGGAEKSGGIVSDGQEIHMGPGQAGDEPYMLAQQLSGVPILVGRDRYRSGQQAVKQFNPDVIILDDGYQHLRLHRDLNILLLDARRPFGNGHLLPRGKLRESMVGLDRANVIIFTRCQSIVQMPQVPAAIRGCPNIFRSSHCPKLYQVTAANDPTPKSALTRLEPIEPKDIAGQPVFAFAGIADNEDFRRTLELLGMDVRGFRAFPDHHRYSDKDQKEIASALQASKAHWLITTEKDHHRMHDWSPLPMLLIVVGVEIVFEGDVRVLDDLLRGT